MSQIIEFLKTTTGKIAVIGCGGLMGLFSLCFICTICGTLTESIGDRQTTTRQAGREVRPTLVTFATESTTLELAEPETTSTEFPPPETPAESPKTEEPPTEALSSEILKPVVVAGQDGVNLYTGPGADYEVFSTLSPGENLEIVGRNADSSWWQVSTPNGLAWVAAGVVTANNVDERILVVEGSPLPVQPTEMPVLIPEPVANYQASASVAIPNPGKNTNQMVYGQLIKDGVGIAGAQMYCVAHYKSKESRWPENSFVITDDNGTASVTFDIGQATSGYTVEVDVYFIYEGQTHQAITSFTPSE